MSDLLWWKGFENTTGASVADPAIAVREWMEGALAAGPLYAE